MGIPGMYGWLCKKYPHTLCSVVAQPYFSNDKSYINSPNPNGVEFDNLYIDLNGIIHPCFHPDGALPGPSSYEDVFKFVFMYIDRVFSIVRPRNLLYLAVDGVAPRAKMNHQRIRRFRATSKPHHHDDLDPNVITPGTDFMNLFSAALLKYVRSRMTDPAWRNIKVIVSDSTVVGEGEYKIMSFIRSQRNLPGYNPNTRHCLHGLDADLIMLALATHEIHLSILREVASYGGHSRNLNKMKNYGKTQKQLYHRSMRQYIHTMKFEFFNIWVLREYLERELLPDVEETDFDRLIDDFVFLCFFIGNDFLPGLPSLDISKGGIERLLNVYQEEYVNMGYLTDAPKVNLKSMEHFLQALSSHENATFMKHPQIQMGNSNGKRKRTGSHNSYDQPGVAELQSITAPNPNDVELATGQVKIHKQFKLGYYTQNFDCKSHDIDLIKRDAVLKYTEGVCWIMQYYYQGLCSWQWFYPYHYAPFASDFSGLDKLEIHFILGQPFKPLDQLLGVLPAASAQALPLNYRELMTEASSPILDFYPKEAKIYKNGKKRAWQGVYKLPFIDESRLLSEAVKVEHTLTDEEKRRNRFGTDRLFVHSQHPLAESIQNLPSSDPTSELQIQIQPELSGGMNGYLCITNKPVGKLKEVKSVDYKCPSHPHIPKIPFGVIMPPKILRSKGRPHPPTSNSCLLLVSESPTKKNQENKKMKQNKIDGKLGDATELKCVDGASAGAGNNEGVDRKHSNNIINGKSEAKVHLVEEQIMSGNDETQQLQVNGDNNGTDEISSYIRKKPTDMTVSTTTRDHESSGREKLVIDTGESKKRNKMNRDKPEEVEVLDLVEFSGPCQNSIKVNIVGEKLYTNKIECDLVPSPSPGQGIKVVSGEHKRKKEEKRKHMLEGAQVEEKVNMNGLRVIEKAQNKGLVFFAKTQEIADDKGVESSTHIEGKDDIVVGSQVEKCEAKPTKRLKSGTKGGKLLANSNGKDVRVRIS